MWEFNLVVGVGGDVKSVGGGDLTDQQWGQVEPLLLGEQLRIGRPGARPVPSATEPVSGIGALPDYSPVRWFGRRPSAAPLAPLDSGFEKRP